MTLEELKKRCEGRRIGGDDGTIVLRCGTVLKLLEMIACLRDSLSHAAAELFEVGGGTDQAVALKRADEIERSL